MPKGCLQDIPFTPTESPPQYCAEAFGCPRHTQGKHTMEVLRRGSAALPETMLATTGTELKARPPPKELTPPTGPEGYRNRLRSCFV